MDFFRLIYYSLITFFIMIFFSLLVDAINTRLSDIYKMNIYLDTFITWLILMFGLYYIKIGVDYIPFFIEVDDSYTISKDISFKNFLFSFNVILIAITQFTLKNNLVQIHNDVNNYFKIRVL